MINYGKYPTFKRIDNVSNLISQVSSMGAQGKIFISYRREDSSDITDRIYKRLCKSFGEESVFRDIHSIPLGVEFKNYIENKIKECKVLLAVIGPNWTDIKDIKGTVRIRSADDLVRTEIESALNGEIPVIPILVRNAEMPMAEDLPETLGPLILRSGTKVRADPDFDHDMNRLIDGLKKYFREPEGSKISRSNIMVVIGISAFIIIGFFYGNGKISDDTLQGDIIRIENAFTKAKEQNTLEAYKKFILDYPDSEFISIEIFSAAMDSVESIENRKEVLIVPCQLFDDREIMATRELTIMKTNEDREWDLTNLDLDIYIQFVRQDNANLIFDLDFKTIENVSGYKVNTFGDTQKQFSKNGFVYELVFCDYVDSTKSIKVILSRVKA